MKDKKIIYGWDTYDNIIHFLYRDQDGVKKLKHIEDFQWYFLITEKDLSIQDVSDLIDLATSKNVVLDVEICSPFAKVYCIGNKYNPRVSWLLNKLKSIDVCIKESDLSLTKRYMVDNLLEIEDNLNYSFFDIETDDTNPGIEIGRDQILSWSICDTKGNSYFEKLENYGCEESEKKLIKNLIKKCLEYDIVIGWNSSQFDIPYIISRIEKLNITTKNNILLTKSIFWKKFIRVDMMQRIIRMFGSNMSSIGLSGFSLNEVANFFVGENKVKHTESIIDLFKNNPVKFEEYNRKDAVLLHKINEKLGVLSLMIKECCWTGSFIDRFYVSELLDNYILREANKQNIHLKSRPEWKSIENDNIIIKGGFVMNPKIGLYNNVRVFDFRSLYPSIIVTWNVGSESLVEEISEQGNLDFNKWLGDRKLEDVDFIEWFEFLKEENKKLNPKNEYVQAANNQYFRRDVKSIIAGLLKKLLDERKEYKKLQAEVEIDSPEYKNFKASQETIKELSNSLYGVTADRKSRFFDPRIAEAITITGQFVNRTTMAIFSKLGFEVVYGDTDSIFISIKQKINTVELAEEVNKKLSTHFKKTYNFLENIILLQYEKKFRKFVIMEKKRYSGHLIYLDGKKTNQILSKGLENVKKTTIEFARRKINECLSLVLKQDKDEVFMESWIKELKEFVLTKDIDPEDLKITTKISKPISEYKTKTTHVRLAEQLIKNKKILETVKGKRVWGQKIEYIVIDGSNKNEAVLVDDFDGKWDRRYYWDVQIFAPLYRILSAMFSSVDWKKFDIGETEKIERRKLREEKKIEREKIREEEKLAREAKKLKKNQLKLI